jgi:uncharacterized alkaline shock family protein YloU
MSHDNPSLGKTTVSPAVLIAIARMAALSVPGVSGMAPAVGGVDRIFRRPADEGIRIVIEDNVVSGDIHLVLKEDVNIREVGRNVQLQVARAIREMVGMEVAQIDVHIENIDYEAAKA